MPSLCNLSLSLFIRASVAFGSTFVFFVLFFSQIFFSFFHLRLEPTNRHCLQTQLCSCFSLPQRRIHTHAALTICRSRYAVRRNTKSSVCEYRLAWERFNIFYIEAHQHQQRQQKVRKNQREKHTETCYFWRCRNAPHYVFTFDITRSRLPLEYKCVKYANSE